MHQTPATRSRNGSQAAAATCGTLTIQGFDPDDIVLFACGVRDRNIAPDDLTTLTATVRNNGNVDANVRVGWYYGGDLLARSRVEDIPSGRDIAFVEEVRPSDQFPNRTEWGTETVTMRVVMAERSVASASLGNLTIGDVGRVEGSTWRALAVGGGALALSEAARRY